MDTIPITRFRASLLATLERVRSTGRPIRITRYGKPIVEILPVRAADWLGGMAGTMEIRGDLVEPLGADWEANRD